MKYIVDHDYHLHSHLSLCSLDPKQTTARMLSYAASSGLHELCLTDHFWDETLPVTFEFYARQDYSHIAQALPLPERDGVRFFFGCETDIDQNGRLGLAPDTFSRFDFVIIPTTHLHMEGFTIAPEDSPLDRRVQLYIRRLDALLDMELPFHKVGIAHLTCPLIAPASWADHIELIRRIPSDTFRRLFTRVAQRGAGVELNLDAFAYTPGDLSEILRPYRIALACGCRFYLGSDAHHPAGLDAAKANFDRLVHLLDLTEDRKFRFHR